MQVFLSYARSDEKFARELSSELTKQGLAVWLDEEQVLPGDNLHERVADALKKSNAMVVLISPQAMKSEFVRSEINYALGNPKYEHRLFPVEVRPTEDVPWFLHELQGFSASQGAKKISQSIASALSQVA